ncbi:MAG: CPBP family glutamic-type intramembrane protease, partial [Arenimonas sp.]
MNSTLEPAMRKIPLREDLKLALYLGIAGAIATVLLFPYLLQLMPELLAKVPAYIPLPALIAIQSTQALVIFGALAFLGLRMGHRIGLDAPWLRAVTTKSERPSLPWRSAIATGLLVALLIVAIDPLFAAHMPSTLSGRPQIEPVTSAWAGFLASFYGGIAEEIQLRLFVMTFLVWLVSFIKKPVHGKIYLAAIIIAALLFGAGHLPAAANIWPLDAVVVARTLLLNSIAGIAFGYWYWKSGLEMAM